jgi:hypothetical protein
MKDGTDVKWTENSDSKIQKRKRIEKLRSEEEGNLAKSYTGEGSTRGKINVVPAWRVLLVPPWEVTCRMKLLTNRRTTTLWFHCSCRMTWKAVKIPVAEECLAEKVHLDHPTMEAS